MSADAAAAESAEVFVEAWQVMVSRLPGSTLIHADGVSTCLGHVPMAFFSVSTPDRPLENADDLRRALRLGVERASSYPYPWMMGLCEERSPAGWPAVAAEFGLTPAMNLTGMGTDELLPRRRSEPASLEFRRVCDDASARDLATVNRHAYRMPPSLFECMCDLSLWRPDTVGLVGYDASGTPVTSAAAFPVAGTVYVAFVATMPEAHGRGYAEAVMRRAIAEGRNLTGYSRVTLHATDMGRPLYASMGFASSARFVLLAGRH